MKTRIAINGFGRIGRLALRAILENDKYHNLDVVAINDVHSVTQGIQLLQYDSVHGQLHHNIKVDGDKLLTERFNIKCLQEKSPANLPWQEMQVDIVLECSGVFSSKEQAMQHIQAGAKKVLVSAPSNNADLTVVYGINHHKINKDHIILSNASCTTNCLAPIAKIINDQFQIISSFMTTIHSYTADQQLVDSNHKDMRRARSSALSMIPTTTGAAQSVAKVIPELQGKIDGTAIRVPTPNVSAVDFTFFTESPLSKESITQAIIASADNELKDILSYTKFPLVSCDFNHNKFSAIVDLSETYMVNNNLGRILAWYDNEWGFANRMLDTTSVIAQHL